MSSLFLQSAVSVIAGALFTLLLVLACITDARTRRIPNKLVLLLAVGGIGYSLMREPGAAAIPSALASIGIGFMIWIPFYAMRIMGAGDVKLFAAASAWLVPSGVLNAALLSALTGGVLSLVWMFRSYGGSFTMFKVTQMASVSGMRSQIVTAREQLDSAAVEMGKKARLPYGIAMAIGLLATAWLPYHLV